VRKIGRSEGKIKCNSASLVIRTVILRADVCYTVTETDMLHRFSVDAVTVIKMKEYQVGESEEMV